MNQSPSTVRTRFAPSPTGFIHLGNIRSALYPWAFARADRRRSSSCASRTPTSSARRRQPCDVILEGMAWLGLDPDEGPYYQMQRMDRYREVLAQMLRATARSTLLHERGRARRAARAPDGRQGKAALRRHLAARARQGTAAGARGRAAGAALHEPGRWHGGVGRQGQGPHRDRQRRTRRPGDRPARRHAHLQLLRGGRRHRHGDHARDPRRRPRQQHAAPDQHLPRARRKSRRCTRTCPPCSTSRARR